MFIVGQRKKHLNLFGAVGRVAGKNLHRLSDLVDARIAGKRAFRTLDTVQGGGQIDQFRADV